MHSGRQIFFPVIRRFSSGLMRMRRFWDAHEGSGSGFCKFGSGRFALGSAVIG